MKTHASYRVQMTPEFNLKALNHIVPYLVDLGIHKLYVSPILSARKGSQHGYDVVDPGILNPELGTEEELISLFEKVKSHGLLWIQDIVPNHMAYSNENKMLVDVLEWGRESTYSDFFDIEWDSRYPSLKGKVLAPFLGQSYNECLESGALHLVFNENGFQVRYHDLFLPINPAGYVSLFRTLLALETSESFSIKDGTISLAGYSTALNDILKQSDFGVKREWFKNVKSHLWSVYHSGAEIKEGIDKIIDYFNGKNNLNDPFLALDKLLINQYYRLAFWKVATEEINYRRFFTVNDLITMNIDKDKVFHFLHYKIFEWVSKGYISELRIDHVDGLYDPSKYLHRLKKNCPHINIYVEKILEFGEILPENWPVSGTTGYDFLGMLNGLFFTSKNYRLFLQFYKKNISFNKSIEEVSAEKKRLILGKHMASNIEELANLLIDVTFFNRVSRDMTLYSLKRALVEVLVCFPVYRSYQTLNAISSDDEKYIKEAVSKALEKNPGMASELAFIESVFLKSNYTLANQNQKESMTHFIMRFQQFSSPLMAKGIEDTLYYNYNFAIGLNEVGGFINQPTSPKIFHKWIKQRHINYPMTMNTTATHDTKRGEDFRARLLALSEFYPEWVEVIKKWFKLNSRYREHYKNGFSPDKNDEYFFYQTLVGSHPFVYKHATFADYADRLKGYIIKSIREAKNYTSWIKPDLDYEEKFQKFIRTLWELPGESLFKTSLQTFVATIQDVALLYSLSQLTLKILCPGMPDFYQGNELWDFHFVDPDNRQDVDYALRNRLLEEVRDMIEERTGIVQKELWSDRFSGKLKLYFMHQLLKLRHAYVDLFESADYYPVLYDKNETAFSFILKNNTHVLWAVIPLQWRQYIRNPLEFIDFNRFKLPENVCHTQWTCGFTGRSVSKRGISSYYNDSGFIPIGVFIQ